MDPIKVVQGLKMLQVAAHFVRMKIPTKCKIENRLTRNEKTRWHKYKVKEHIPSCIGHKMGTQSQKTLNRLCVDTFCHTAQFQLLEANSHQFYFSHSNKAMISLYTQNYFPFLHSSFFLSAQLAS